MIPTRKYFIRLRHRSRCYAILALLLILFTIHNFFLSDPEPLADPKPPVTLAPNASPNATPSITVEYLRNRYFSPDAAREVTNENPVCVLPREYATMPWHTTDVRRATKEYLRRHTHVIVITGSYDNYTRVKAALCTWMGHVPSDALLFVTDHLPPEMQLRQRQQEAEDTPLHRSQDTADSDPVLRVGQWRARDETKPDPRLTVYEAANEERTAVWNHPRGWFTAQLRFFDALQYAYDIQYPGLVSEDMQYKRWVMILDDDTYVHLDSLVATLQRHSVSQLLESNDYWWHILLRRTVLTSVFRRNTHHATLEAASRKAWEQRCTDMMSADPTNLTAFQRAARRTATYEECVALPERIVDTVLPTTLKDGNISAMLHRHSNVQLTRESVVRRLAYVFSNLIFLLDDESYETQSSVWWQMWNEMDGLLSTPWVQAFATAPTLMPGYIAAGQGSFFNAPLFYNRFFRADPPRVSEPTSISPDLPAGPSGIPANHYAYYRICVDVYFFRYFCISDGCFRECLEDIGGGSEEEDCLSDKIAKGLIRFGNHNTKLGPLRSETVRHLNTLSSTVVAELARNDIYFWATGHVKMEFFDAMRDMSGRDKGKLHLTPTQVADLQRLSHFRMRLYYDVIYREDKESVPVLLLFGAQVDAEYKEWSGPLNHIKTVTRDLFLPAIGRPART